MNRLFLIGNGFDLAHGLRTNYSDLMKYIYYTYPETFQTLNKLISEDFYVGYDLFGDETSTNRRFIDYKNAFKNTWWKLEICMQDLLLEESQKKLTEM